MNVLKQQIFSSFFLPETRSILAVAKSNSFLMPSIEKIIALNTMIKRFKSEGIWDRYDNHFIAAYNDVNVNDFTKINIVNPRSSILFAGSTVVQSASGWKFSGGGYNTDYRPLSGVKLTLNNAHQSAVVYDVSQATSATNSIIAGGTSNGIDRWCAWNTNFQRINANSSLSSNADLSGTGFKTINRKSETEVVLTNKSTVLNRTGSSNILAVNDHMIGSNSTNYSKLGLSTFSMGSAIDDVSEIIREIYNEFFTEIGLTAIA